MSDSGKKSSGNFNESVNPSRPMEKSVNPRVDHGGVNNTMNPRTPVQPQETTTSNNPPPPVKK